MKYRVLRTLEYTYGSAQRMLKDMARWQVGANASYEPSQGHHVKPEDTLVIRSSTMQGEAVVMSDAEAFEAAKVLYKALLLARAVLEEDPKPDLDDSPAVEAWRIRTASMAEPLIDTINELLERITH
jgi:hypothetical protein